MELGKRKNLKIITGAFITIGLVVVFVYVPLLNKAQKLQYEISKIENDTHLASDLIQKKNVIVNSRSLIKQDEVVLIIDAITSTGKEFDINFISISPKEVERLPDMPYSRMPIEINAASEYKNLGLFLGALRTLNKSVVTLKSLDIKRNEGVLPLVVSTFTLEVYLKDG